jgi:FKBP-type peptidyl-prolyl cis-trans isomerase
MTRTRTMLLASALLMLVLLGAPACSPPASRPVEGSGEATKTQKEGEAPKTQKEKVGYGIGVDMAKNFQRVGAEVDADMLAKGIKDAMTGGKLLMTDDEIRATLVAYQDELMQKQAHAKEKSGEDDKKAGEAFLAENKKKEGVVTLPSGLQYKILKAGSGKKPTAENTVECHYKGTLINGTEFDSSYRGGRPASFNVSRVITGWTEALQLMPVGSKWQLVIPSQLAYGERGTPDGSIGPNATLIFEVELLGIK